MRLLALPVTLLTAIVLAKYQDAIAEYITKQTLISETAIVLEDSALRAGVAPAHIYTRIRDASVVYNFWVNQLTWGDHNFRSLIDGAVRVLEESQTALDTSESNSKEPLTVELSSQPRDVPALRATVLCKYGEWLLGQQNGSWVAEELWPVINRDLGWIHRHWNDSWVMIDGETIDTQSFWTAVVQHRALRSGAALGRKLRSMDDLAGYEMQAKKILVHMQTFWYEKEGQIRARRFDGRSGLDSAAHLASVWNFDPVGGCDALTFQPCSDRALSNLKATIDRFKGLYPVSKYIPESEPGPLSMQFEDTYEGDMPWQLVIFGAAEQLYDALTTWALFESLSVTRISLPFFRLFSTDVAPGTYMKTSDMYNTLTGRVRAYADRALLLCAERTLDNGVPPEGRDGNIGVWTNATRTHVAALTAFAARQGKAPAPWGAKHVLWEFGELEDDGWEVLPDSPFVKKVVEFVLKMYHRAM